MDAIKILGSLLSNNAMGSSVGQNVLGALLGGGGGGGNNNAAAGILGALLGGNQRQSGGGLGALGGLLGAASSHGGGGGGGLGVLGSLLGGGGGSGNLGALAGLLGGGQQQSGGGGIAGLLGGLLGGGGQQQQSSGAGGILGSLLGGGGGSGGGGADLMGLLGGAAQGGNASDMLGALLGGAEAPEAPPKEAHSEAEILICAMCNAAKSDGQIDEQERDAILGRLGDLDQAEVDFVKNELSSPLDLGHFVNDVPDDMAQQVYAFSLMAIKLDTQKEARYFGDLAQALHIDGDTANEIHNQLGQPEIFA